jgi:hypothetical protein
MSNFVELKPIVYRIIKNDKDWFNLKEVCENYPRKKKLYGPIFKVLFRISRLIKLKLFGSISILCTGKKGLGKTTTSNEICNTLIKDGIPIIEIKYIDVNTNLIEFLSNFRNCAIYIDEFGKIFNNEYQEKMLTVLNKNDEYYNIFILGENELYKISNFILDRMERIRYHVRHDRISKDDLEEYCKDNSMSYDMLTNLNRINGKSSVISYDTLEVLAEEHKLFPELPFEELVEIMNCQGIIGISVIDVLDVQIESDTMFIEKFALTDWSSRVKESNFIDGSKLTIALTIGMIKDEEKQEVKTNPVIGSNMPMSFGIHPMHASNTLSYNITIGSGDIESINDIDGIITATTKYDNKKITIILGSKLIPSTAY